MPARHLTRGGFPTQSLLTPPARSVGFAPRADYRGLAALGAHSMTQAHLPSPPRRSGILDWIEWIGNTLPDPVTLFAIGALLVMVLSWAASVAKWEVVQKMPQQLVQPVLDEHGRPVIDEQTGEARTEPVIDPATGQQLLEWRETGVVYRPQNLLSRDGIDWAFRSMVDNFRLFPPLGVVLVGMLGIGVAERTGLLAAALKGFMLALRGALSFTPEKWSLADKVLTPAMVFIGIMSSLATDAGYVVLPPLAAALYKSVGRSPLAGLAAVFAGVSAGFSANLVITGLEPMLAELTYTGSRVIDEAYRINPACNWWFMIGSTILITFTGWLVTAVFVERRLKRRSPEEGGPAPATDEDMAAQQLKRHEIRGLGWAGAALAVFAVVALCLIVIPGAPLYTYKMPDPAAPERAVIADVWHAPTPESAAPESAHVRDDGIVLVKSDRRFDRWVDAIVPLLFLGFIIPGITYGRASGEVKSDKDVAKLMMESMAAMAPIIVLAFVAGQFIGYFSHSNLDRMLAMAGGMWLGQQGFTPYTLIVAFIIVTLIFNLFMGSMSAKYTLFAPIFVPMFMMVGIAPELTQAAYRVGDSVSNIITPLNAYLIIILVFMQRYVPKGGMGTLIATMFPYTLVFTIIWTIFLLLWMWLGQPLGVDGPLWYDPTAAAGALG
jgi:aminobenzoyl-glutamate transport protein